MAGVKDRADAQARERALVMPSPVTTARRGITVGRYLGLSEHQAALMVMVACGAAVASANMDGAPDVSWLEAIHAEASRVYDRMRPADCEDCQTTGGCRCNQDGR